MTAKGQHKSSTSNVARSLQKRHKKPRQIRDKQHHKSTTKKHLPKMGGYLKKHELTKRYPIKTKAAHAANVNGKPSGSISTNIIQRAREESNLTNEEMALAIQKGEKSLIEPLWEQLKRLIGMYTGRCFNRMQSRCAAAGVTEEDLIQTGFFALLDAVKAYDPARGYKLTAFLKYPLQNRFNALLGLRNAKGRNNPLNSCDSLDEPIGGEDDDFTRSDIIPDEKAEQAFDDAIECEWRRSLRTVEEQLIDERLTEGETTAIRGAFFEGLKLQPIADRLGVTRERVRQLQYHGLRRLRTGDAVKKLRPFMYDEYEALGLRGTGLSAFRNNGSATERAVETLERRREQQEREERFARYESMTLEELLAERERLHRQSEERWRARLIFEPSDQTVLNKTPC